MFSPCGGPAQPRLHHGARTVSAIQRQFEMHRAFAGPGELQAQGRGQVLQHGQHAVMAHQRLHHRMANGKLHRRRQGRQGRAGEAKRGVEPFHQPGMPLPCPEAAGKAGTRHVIELADALEPGTPERRHRVCIEVERLHWQRGQRGSLCTFGHDGAAELAEAGNGPGGGHGAGKACAGGHVELAETAGHVGHQHCLAAEQVRHAGHVEQQAVRCVHRHPRAPALGPARHAQQAGGVLDGLVHGGGEVRHFRPCIGQTFAGLEAAGARLVIAGSKPKPPRAGGDQHERHVRRQERARQPLRRQCPFQPFDRQVGKPERNDALHDASPRSRRRVCRPGCG